MLPTRRSHRVATSDRRDRLPASSAISCVMVSPEDWLPPRTSHPSVFRVIGADRPGLPHRCGVVVAGEHGVARSAVEVLDLPQLRLAGPRPVAAEHPVDGVAGRRQERREQRLGVVDELQGDVQDGVPARC